jgi:hypothetical protein
MKSTGQPDPSAQAAGPSPGLFVQTVNAFQRTAAIRAAVEPDLFTGVAEGRQTPAEPAARTGAARRGECVPRPPGRERRVRRGSGDHER